MNSLAGTAATATAATAAAAAGCPITGLSRQNVHGNGVLCRHHTPVV